MKKRILYLPAMAIASMAVIGCNGGGAGGSSDGKDSTSVEVTDSAIYGVIGEGTTMHNLEIVTGDGKTLTYEMNLDDSICDVQGGVFCGDRVTLTVTKGEDGSPSIAKLVNLTTLLGKWTSLARNFEIKEDGEVVSSQESETNPYTQWKMCNTRLILNSDTFDVVTLGPDTLEIENTEGIFAYKRVGKSK